MQAPTWIWSLQLHLLGSHPGAGSTHNPLRSCQNSICRALRHLSKVTLALAGLHDEPSRRALPFGSESCEDALHSLEKVLRFASRLLTLHNLSDVTNDIFRNYEPTLIGCERLAGRRIHPCRMSIDRGWSSVSQAHIAGIIISTSFFIEEKLRRGPSGVHGRRTRRAVCHGRCCVCATMLYKHTGSCSTRPDADALRTVFNSSIVVHTAIPRSTPKLTAALRHPPVKIIIKTFGVRGDGQVDAVERFCRPDWARYCTSTADANPVEAKQGWLIEEDTTCTGNPADTWKSQLVDLRLATGSRITETFAEMAPVE